MYGILQKNKNSYRYKFSLCRSSHRILHKLNLYYNKNKKPDDSRKQQIT